MAPEPSSGPMGAPGTAEDRVRPDGQALDPTGDVRVDAGAVAPVVGDGPDPSDDGTGRVRWVPWTALAVYLACRVVTVVFVAVANLFTHNSVLYDLDIWDGAWFLRIVAHGYPAHLPMTGGHVAANPIAFFPGFPLVVRALDVTGLPPGAVALVVSGVTGGAAVVAVGLLARRLAGDDAGRRAALLFALFPGTFAFSLGYSEGIVITCAAVGLVALLDRRWLLAGVLGAVATASSPVGLAFVVSCAWAAGAAIVARRQWRSLVAPLLAPLGFVAYMAYLAVHTGQVNAWRLTERGGWKSYPSLRYPFRIVWTFVSDPVQPTLTGQILFVGTVAAAIGVVLMLKERQPVPVVLYALCALGAGAISQPVGLRPRFLMLAFPMVVALGTRYEGRTHRWLVAVSAVLLTGVTVLELASRAVFP